MTRLIDLTAKQFGRLTVIERAENQYVVNTQACWLCRCACGVLKVVLGQTLRSGLANSCGCLSREMTITRSTIHGQSRRGDKTRTYRVWLSMVNRCRNPNAEGYADYGARGIMVCDRWLTSFENFFVDMGECPPGLTIERIDNNGNYEPTNCKWATQTTQARNRRSNRIVTINGETMCLVEAVERFGCGLSYDTVSRRINGLGWSIEDALRR